MPEALEGADELLKKAAAAGLRAALVVDKAESAKITAKRRHDIKAALRTLGFAAKALESGYTFQDDMAAAKREAIVKAVQVLESEGTLWLKALGPD